MNKNRRLKKGFTLVELVVVIAVIAILAAVSVGAYFGITESANRSADEQAVTQLNKMLETYEILTGRVDNVEEAKDIFEDNGVTNYKPFFDKNTFYWTHADSRVIIWTEGKGVTFPSWAAENYKSYKEQVSADWYNLQGELIIKDFDTNGDFGSAIQSMSDENVLKFPENSTYDVAAGEFFLLYNSFAQQSFNTLTIDLNGSTLDSNSHTYQDSNGENKVHSIDVPTNKTLIIENGTLDISIAGTTDPDQNSPSSIYLNIGSTLVLRNVTLNSDYNGFFVGHPAAELILDNCTINAVLYGIGTNASKTADIYTQIKVRNSTINAQEGIFLNVKGSIEIDNSIINSDFHPIALRTGTIVARKTTINFTENYDTNYFAYYGKFAKNYGTYLSGNGFPVAAVMLGNYTDYSDKVENDYHPYAGAVNATFVDCKLNTPNAATTPQFLLSADCFTNVTLKYTGGNVNSANIVQYEAVINKLSVNTGTIHINGTEYNYSANKYNG